MRKLLIGFVCLSLLGVVHARLGDTPDQNAKRYPQAVPDTGNTFKHADRTMFYFSSEFFVIVGYIDGQSAIESVAHNKGPDDMDPPEITKIELDALLAANAGTNSWKSLESVFRKR